MRAGREEVTEAIRGFCEYLESKKYYVAIYSSLNWFQNYLEVEKLTKYDKWVASWGTSKPLILDVGIWQFGGDVNKIRFHEIAGVVCDQDYAYKDYPSIMKDYGLNGYPKRDEPEYYPKVEYQGDSIVEALESIGVDSSYSYRAKIAKENGIVDYRGSAFQNTQMLNLLKQGKLKKI